MREKIKNRIQYLSRTATAKPVHESTVVGADLATSTNQQVQRNDSDQIEESHQPPTAKLVKCLEDSESESSVDVEGIVNQTLNETMANDNLNASNLTFEI